MPQKDRNAGRTTGVPRAAAIAGIIFAILLTLSLVLIRLALPATAQAVIDESPYLPIARSLIVGLNLMPFAGIAFLWFIGVLRDYIGAQEDRFLATVILGSGVLFIAMLFVTAGNAAGLLTSIAAGAIDADIFQYGRAVSYAVAYVYAARMAGVFMISTTTLTRRAGIMPQWLTITGYLFATLLLISVSIFEWILLLFPLWVLLVSVVIFNAKSLRPHVVNKATPES